MTSLPHARRIPADAIAIALLAALWTLFFWRLLTPVAADQMSLKLGDFSGQFVAFGGYQYERLSRGEVPLWNPYNNGGLPFIADTQAAVFYPPRLATIALASLSGGWSYHDLELEMMAHVLLYSLLMYGLARRMTLRQSGSVFGAFVAAVIAGYSGFTVGYPLLQLAILEAGAWLPLALLGIYEATRTQRLRLPWLLVTGVALGISWMAGHPQTSYFLTLLLVAYTAYRCYAVRARWTWFVGAVALYGVVSFGLAAVQLLPGFEYLSRTARVDMGYEAKGNGFPIQDVVQFFVPGVMSLFSPLFVGLTGLALAALAVWRRLPESRFWAVVAVFALLWSFGANGPLYPLLYHTLPGLQFFRGQERAAYLVMNSLAILAALGGTTLLTSSDWRRHFERGLWLLAALLGVLAAFTVAGWLGAPEAYGNSIGQVVRSALVTVALVVAVRVAAHRWLLAGLLVFELFSVSMGASAIYDSIPPGEQVPMAAPPLVSAAVTDMNTLTRVDGFRGLTDNYGSLYNVLDMRGISPLFLSGPFSLIEPDKINPRAWELFAVSYVYSDWSELPVPSEIITDGVDRYGPVNLHRLSNPRPFAHMVYEAQVAPSAEAALGMARDPNINIRAAAVLEQPPSVILPDEAPEHTTIVSAFAPEQFTVDVETPAAGILTLAHPYYPGWVAMLDNEPTALLRTYGALTGVEVPAGTHTVTLTYQPLSYRIGAVMSGLFWLVSVILLVVLGLRGGFQRPAQSPKDI
jgi:hypothetical protein